ncbi:single-stranded-DNA-specific exonuclease RecJ [Planctomycetota bacterium]
MLITAGTQSYQWTVEPADAAASDLAQALKVSPLVAQVLINRGLDTREAAHAFLSPKLTSLIRPEVMPGMAGAVGRIKQAIEASEKLTIYGDYDVDGITGVSILLNLLSRLGAQLDYYIPHRLDEGYGLNADAVRQLAATGTKLLITVDCGITGIESARLAADLGMDVIITDHHQPEQTQPPAVAIVHPLLASDYPNPDSAGAMVAYKLAWACADAFSNGPRLADDMRQAMLDATSLAAVGTVADVVDLRGENRVLTHYGLKALPASGLCGVQALIDSAGLTGKGVDSYDIGFKIGPMLNAAGRMGHARLAVELLTSQSEQRAREIADYLRQQNQQRQQFGRKIFKEACEQVVAGGMNHPDRRSIVLAGENWHRGVLGIVASRVADKFFRPTVILNPLDDDSGHAQGSGRSIPGFCLLSAIRACSEHLVAFGGHTMAAGLTLGTERVECFADAFEAYAQKHLKHDDIVARLSVDALTSLDQLHLAAVGQLQLLGPFGRGNPRPMFATQGVRLLNPPRRVGAKGDHLQLAVTDNTNAIRCIGFGMGKLEKKLLELDSFSIAYEPQINEYNGYKNTQLVLTDIQFD